MKSFKEIINQPTTDSGTLKEKIWPTLLADMEKEGRLANPADDTYVLEGVSYTVNPKAAVAYALGINKGNMPAILRCFSREFCTPMQQDVADRGISAATNVVDEGRMDSATRRAYYISQAQPKPPVLLDERVLVGRDDIEIDIKLEAAATITAALKAYKAELKKPVTLTEEQEESLRLQAVEESRFNALYDMGFSKVLPVHGNKKNLLQTRVIPVLDKVNLLKMLDVLITAGIDVQTVKMEHDIMTDCSTVVFQDSK